MACSGPATVEEVKTFQTANGLTANGVVGTKTWEKLIVEPDDGEHR